MNQFNEGTGHHRNKKCCTRTKLTNRSWKGAKSKKRRNAIKSHLCGKFDLMNRKPSVGDWYNPAGNASYENERKSFSVMIAQNGSPGCHTFRSTKKRNIFVPFFCFCFLGAPRCSKWIYDWWQNCFGIKIVPCSTILHIRLHNLRLCPQGCAQRCPIPCGKCDTFCIWLRNTPLLGIFIFHVWGGVNRIGAIVLRDNHEYDLY